MSIQPPKALRKQRNREVARVLLRIKRLKTGADAFEKNSTVVRQFRDALETLGARFALFGHYLASRADLFSLSDCLVLGGIKDQAAATSFDDVCALFQEQIGRPLEEAYASFEPEPFESRTIYQCHRAHLHSGREVIVKIQHPDASDRLNRDGVLLGKLGRVWTALGHTQETLTAVLAHFDRALALQMDFEREKDALYILQDDLQTSQWCRVPTVYPALCASDILTCQWLENRLDWMMRPDAVEVESINSSENRRALAQSLCAGWLHQVFRGHPFPGFPRLDHLAGSSDGSIVFLNGPFVKLSGDVRENIWAYLTAAVQHDPERACLCLLKEMDAAHATCDEKTLRHLFRQVVPFRDGGWGNIGVQDSLPEHLLMHWRLATTHGYRPHAQLLAFFQSLFLKVTTVHQLVPDDDPFMEALVSYQDRLRSDQFQAGFATEQWADALDKYASSFSELPQKIDDLLTRAAGGDLTLNFRIREAPEHRQTRNASSIAISLLLLLVAAVLLVYHLSHLGIGNMWIKQAGAVAFLMISGILLWIIIRPKSGKE
ncbi:MAG: AarF/UbiB family protein [Candidatus Latescibacteria bacterium]|nr:AarF/UbiB family protein [Candidatus Latescibacterota bacterium]